MNIGSSNVLSMLPAGESVDTIQPLLPENSAGSLEFSEQLVAKIQQLQGEGKAAEGNPALLGERFNADSQLHKIAGLISSDQTLNQSLRFLGKDLPPETSLEKEIDLENTLETLANVLNTLDDSLQETGDVFSQIEESIDTVKSIKQQQSEKGEVIIQLDSIMNELEALKSSASISELSDEIQQSNGGNTLELEHQNIKQLDVMESVEQVQSLLSTLKQSISSAPVSEAIYTGEEQAYRVSSELSKNIEQLSAGIKSIEKTFSQKYRASIDEPLATQTLNDQPITPSIEQLRSFGSDLVGDHLKDKAEFVNNISVKKTDKSNVKQSQTMPFLEGSTDEVDIENTMASILSTLTIPNKIDTEAGALVYQDTKPLPNQQTLSIKQLIEQQNLGAVVKANVDGGDDSLQIVPTDNKAGQHNIDSLFMNKQTQSNQPNTLDGKEPELTAERILPKFATDIANLSRAVIPENKVDIPTMTKHFAHPEWNKEMGEKVIWMHKQAVPSAELRLNPGHLGPITIKIDTTQDQVTVAFTAQHAVVKEAIDAALPKLREMFSAQQLNLAEVSVSQEDAGQKQHKGFSQMGSGAGKDEKQQNEIIENELTEKTMDIAEEIEAGRAIASSGVLSIFA